MTALRSRWGGFVVSVERVAGVGPVAGAATTAGTCSLVFSLPAAGAQGVEPQADGPHAAWGVVAPVPVEAGSLSAAVAAGTVAPGTVAAGAGAA
ncbi:MAG: hypothetical protein ACKO3P_14950, partial [Planctomycetaceae bacterium]